LESAWLGADEMTLNIELSLGKGRGRGGKSKNRDNTNAITSLVSENRWHGAC